MSEEFRTIQSSIHEHTVNEQESRADVGFRDVAPALELGCWTVVVLAPFLRYVNGPAVSTDQFTIQIVMVAAAATSAIGLRIYSWRTQNRKPSRSE
jgi:hypothetical protein